MTRRSPVSVSSSEARLAGLENAVWSGVAKQSQRAQRAMVALAAMAFLLVSAASYGVGAMQGRHAELHFSMAAELSHDGDLFDEQVG